MNFTELQLFNHLASTLHFGRTSIECNITASALTRAIQRLENEVGKPLLSRNNRSVSLTQSGVIFKEFCEETITRWNHLQARLQDDDTLSGELTIYCSVTAIFSILPQLLGSFRKAHPKVSIHIQTGDAAKALQKLHNCDVDLVIAALPDHQPSGVDSISLLQTPLVFIISKMFRESVNYDGDAIDIEKTPVILPTEGLSRIRAEEWFAKKHIKPTIYAQVSGNEAIIALVSIGCGIGIVPLLVLEKSSLKSEVDVIPLTPNLTPFTVGVCALKKNRENKILQSFWEIIDQQQVATLNPSK